MLIKILYIAARIVAAYIMLQTLWFKLSGAEESIYIFKTVGMEPWGRYGIALAELVASILLLLPRTVWLGSLMTVGLMLGAITMHLTKLGIVVFDDGGQLFIYACITLVCGGYTLVHDRATVLRYMALFRTK